MASSGTQKVCATEGRELEAGKRYREIKDIISHNTNVPFKTVLKRIADIDYKSYDNYIREGKQYGRVSLYTVEKLAHYFNMPVGVFDCSSDFTDQDKQQIADKISQDFSSVSRPVTVQEEQQGYRVGIDSQVIKELRALARPLGNENDQDALQEVVDKLEMLLIIAKSRLEIVESIGKIEQ